MVNNHAQLQKLNSIALLNGINVEFIEKDSAIFARYGKHEFEVNKFRDFDQKLKELKSQPDKLSLGERIIGTFKKYIH